MFIKQCGANVLDETFINSCFDWSMTIEGRYNGNKKIRFIFAMIYQHVTEDMRKIMIIAAAMLLFVWNANAQFTLGAGYRHQSFCEKEGNIQEVSKYNGAYALAQYNFKLVAGLGIAPGVEFSWNSSKDAAESNYFNIKTLNLTIPVDLNYQFVVSDKLGIGFLIGGFADCSLTNSSDITVGGTTTTIYWSGTSSDRPYYAWNYGVRFGVNFDIVKRIRISLTHDEGVRDLSRSELTKDRGRACKFGVSYIF